MRTETITRNLYTFPELSEKAKKTARNWWISSASCDDQWWEWTLEDAARIGLKIDSFDTYRRDIEGGFITSAVDCAEKILKEHGEGCPTHETAFSFLKEMEKFMEEAEKDEWGELATYDLERQLEDMEKEFLQEILEDFLSILKKEEEWYFSDKNAEENILCNEYEFTEEGKIA